MVGVPQRTKWTSDAAEGGHPVLGAFHVAPLSMASGGSIRRRRLAEAVSHLGPMTAVIMQDLDTKTQFELGAALDARVISVPLSRRTRARAFIHWMAHPATPWTAARVDFAPVRMVLGEIDGRAPRCWFGAPGSRRGWRYQGGSVSSAVVDVIDLPSQNGLAMAVSLGRILIRGVRSRRRLDRESLLLARRIVLHLEGSIRSRLSERAIAHHGRAIVVANGREAARWANAHQVRNGFDDPGPLRDDAGRTTVTRFVFPASFKYPPNRDGAEWFIDRVVPGLRRSCPHQRIVLAGDGSESLGRLGSVNGVEVTGRLDDMADAYGAGTVVVVPLLTGSGTRIKIIEAWARGFPVVSTTKGAEGVDATHGAELLLADSAEDFAAACRRLVSSVDLRRRLVHAGRARYDAAFKWEHAGRDIRRILNV